MNNDNFVATHLRTVVQYTIECETIPKIYSVRKLNTLIYVRCVICLFWILFFIDFFDFVFYLYLKFFFVS